MDCGGSSCAPCAGAPDCAAACATTAESGCFDSASCIETCKAEAPGWSPAVLGAFTQCAAENPLCYQSLEDCMLGVLYPDEVVQQASLTGAGFEAYEGYTVHASLEKAGGALVAAPPQKVSGGGFAFDWSVAMTISGAGLMLYYIDLDESGSCSVPADRAGSTFAERSKGFDVPSWTAAVTPPADPKAYAFVCDAL